MSNPLITLAIAHPDPSFAPTTLDQAWTATGGLKDLITATLQGTYTPYVMSASIPAVNDQDKIWFKLDGAGRPLGAYKFYSGAWMRVYPYPIGTIVLFSGDPSGLFDGTGLGIAGTDWIGFAIANGNNGTPNLADKFVIGSGTYSTTWKTTVAGTSLQTGGTSTITLDDAHTYRPATPLLTVGKWGADGNAASASGNLYGTVNTDVTKNTTLIGADAGQTSPTPIPIIPPFYALAYVMFRGYS